LTKRAPESTARLPPLPFGDHGSRKSERVLGADTPDGYVPLHLDRGDGAGLTAADGRQE
jgi:hypothetical protein